jgi:hypothetical protein
VRRQVRFYFECSFVARLARDTSVLSANAIRSSLNFISDLFGRFLYALAWEEKYRYARRHRLRGVSAVAASAEFSMRSSKRVSAMQNATLDV